MSRNSLQRTNPHTSIARRDVPPGMTLIPEDTSKRSAMLAFSYVAMLGLLPTVAVGLNYQFTPFAAWMVLARVFVTAPQLAAQRRPAFEDTSPLVAAVVLCTVVWAALLLAMLSAPFFYFPQNATLFQLVAGGFLAVLGPGLVLEKTDLPRRIVAPIQLSPSLPAELHRPVVRGQEVLTTQQVIARRQAMRQERQLSQEHAPAGTSLESAEYAVPDGRQMGFPWGGVLFLINEFSNINRFVIGMQGSGKTLIMRLLMAALLPWPRGLRNSSSPSLGGSLKLYDPVAETPYRVQREKIFQSVVYDGKSEHINRLCAHGFTPGKDLLIFHPLDERAMVWDLSKDVLDRTHAKDFASLVVADITVPQNQTANAKHFLDAAKRVVWHVVEVLQRNGNWRLRDLILAFSTREMCEHLLDQHPEGGDSRYHLTHSEEGSGVFSTLKIHLDELALVAAVWDHIERKHGPHRCLSLTEWVEKGEGTVLLLPNGADNPEITRPFNRFLFRRLTDLMLAPSQLRKGRHRSVFLDELPTAGKLTTLDTLLTKGREYGVYVTLGVQDISQMYKTYGKDDTNIIVNSCPFRAYLKCLGETAEWCSRQVGKQVIRWQQQNYGFNEGHNEGEGESLNKDSARVWLQNYQNTMGQNRGASEQEREQDALMPSYFMNLPDIRASHLVAGYYAHPDRATWGNVSRLEHVLSQVAWEPDQGDPEFQSPFMKVPNEVMFLRPWEKKDYQRLAIPEPSSELPPKPVELRDRPSRKRRAKSTPPQHDF